jgi:hypothetical protein
MTCGFPYSDDGGGVLGPHPVRLCRRAGTLVDLLEALGERVELVGVQVPVAVQRLHRVLVADLACSGRGTGQAAPQAVAIQSSTPSSSLGS